MEFEILSNWYRRADVKFELIKQLYKREFALLVPSWIKDADIKKRSTRMLKVHNVGHLDFVLKALEFHEKKTPYNFYYSLAQYYDGIPNQDLNFTRRKENGINEDWKYRHETEMKGFDFLLDIDAGGHEDILFAYESAKLIKQFYDNNDCPYILRFSGKGFHFVIPYHYLPQFSLEGFQDKTQYMYYSMIAKRLYEKFSELIDLSIYDSRRVCKLSYSIANYEDNSYVAYPFGTNKEFEDFRLRDFEVSNFDKPIYRRGEHVFNMSMSPQKMLKKLEVEHG